MPTSLQRTKDHEPPEPDGSGRFHCWRCGRFLASRRFRGPHHTYLCGHCHDLEELESHRLYAARRRAERAAQRGRVLRPYYR